jgi:hypothetical protein
LNQAISLEPKVPNPYYCLATMFNNAGKAGEALATLEQMFEAAEFDDARTADLRKECRKFHLSRGKAVVPHIVALELESLRMEHEAREAGRAYILRYMHECPERAGAIEEHARQLAQGDIGGTEARTFVAKVTDTLSPCLPGRNAHLP